MHSDMPSSQNNFVILIVDDSAQNCLLLRRILEKQGYLTAECRNGRQCIEYCNNNELPAVILMDVMMPEVDGITACSTLRQKYNKEELPIILVTAKAEAMDIAEGLKTGANDYVIKPIDRVVLLARLENQLTVRSSRLALHDEKLKLEQALTVQKTIGDVLPEAILIEDPQGFIIYSNHGMRSLCAGETPRQISDVFAKLWEGAIADKLLAYRQQVMAQADIVISEEIRFGTTMTNCIQLSSKPIRFIDESVNRLWLFNDITHTRLLERKIKEHMRLETVSLFATGVAHNFNNIMGGIQGATEILQNIAKDNRVGQKCIGIISKAIEQGTNLTNKMATLKKERIKDDGFEEDINQLIFQVVEIQKQLVGDRITFALQLEGEAALVPASAKNLIDILSNLLSNAVDAIPYAGSIKIRSSIDHKAGIVTIDIKDSGTGMTQEVLDKAFEPFFSTKHLDHVNGMSMVGNGLGLWNVYNLTNMLGGDIQLSSEKGNGTSVVLRLPMSASRRGTQVAIPNVADPGQDR